MKIECNGPVEGDTYGLTNQLAINEEIYSIGTTLMDKSDETLYQIYLCEETGVKHFSKLGEGDNYMKFVLPISKLGEGREQVTLEASDCTEISSGGKSITGASGSIKILPEQSGKIGFVADITSEGTRYQALIQGNILHQVLLLHANCHRDMYIISIPMGKRPLWPLKKLQLMKNFKNILISFLKWTMS